MFQPAQRNPPAEGVHPDLIRVIRRALALYPVDFGITELRSVAREKEMVDEGHNETMHSCQLTGHVVDVVAYAARDHEQIMQIFAEIMLSMKRINERMVRLIDSSGGQ